ncbi:MAG TPA: hypothetical protein VJ372_03345 [Pyrinomonadaceae bacterium]|nr:hypothetical protein [Pyrinomonadaceae bacterium]
MDRLRFTPGRKFIYVNLPWTAELEITATFFVTTVAIEFDCVACTFTRRTAILTARLGRAGTNGIFTLVLLIVCHWEPPEL